MIDLRLGRWQDVLRDVECDVSVFDPPYSKRNLAGFRSGSDVKKRDLDFAIPYDAWTARQYHELLRWACSATRHWLVLFSDHTGFRWAEAAAARAGWYTFAPVIWVKPDGPPRMAADGSASSCEHILVARPKRSVEPLRRGSRKGWYLSRIVNGKSGDRVIVGSKPLDLVRAIVREYTLPGDLICDATAGSGTTLLAAAIEGRRAVGAECDPATFAKARARIDRGYTPNLFASGPRVRVDQPSLTLGEAVL